MTNFTAQDAWGMAVAVVVFAGALYAPGYLVGQITGLFGFRRMSFLQQGAWSVAYSFAATPILGYILAKYAGFSVACAVMILLAAVAVVVNMRRRPGSVSRQVWLALAFGGLLWAVFVFVSLADIQIGHKLYFSVVEFDQSYRVAFTDTVMRSGVPPANPLYFSGHAQPMRYYYFWYVLCAMVAHVGHVTARQAFLASSVWTGFELVAVVALFVRHMLGVTNGLRRQIAITVALLAVTGADVLPAVGSIFTQPALNGEMEWWSIDQFSSWQDSLLWVPHHTAALLGCMVALLLLWMTLRSSFAELLPAMVIAGIAIASAFGTSIYLAFGFALLMGGWLLLARGERVAIARGLGIVSAVSLVLLLPFLTELLHSASSTGAGANAHASRIFSLSIRRMIDPELLTALPVFAGLRASHSAALDAGMRLLLMPLGLALELGFFGAVLVLFYRERKRTAAQSTLLLLSVVGLVAVLFVRSSVISNNDFGYRAALLPQFFLLLLGGDLLASWWGGGKEAAVAKTPWRTRMVYGLAVLGVGGTIYQGMMLRVFLPLEARSEQTGFARLPAKMMDARRALTALQRVSDPHAVLAFNAVDPAPTGRGDVVSPFTFFSRGLLMNANRQILSAEATCAVEFGGEMGPCAAIESDTAELFSAAGRDAAWAKAYCGRFGVSYIAVTEQDPAWRNANGWAWALPVADAEPSLRVLRCAP